VLNAGYSEREEERPLSLLSAEKVTQELESLPGWKLENKEIVRTYEFPDFPAAIQFVRRVAEKAESAGHHPDIDIRYNKVRLALVSHDAGGLTDHDMAMARSLNLLD
jgi:4a-hydroxytetrahydrobiopterin dehydratase